jgi:hypothetical protein
VPRCQAAARVEGVTIMTDNIIDFEAFADRELGREELAFLRAERDALIAFVLRSDSHANFAKWALSNYAERVRDSSSQAIEWPFALHERIGECSDTAKQFDREWIGLAGEFLADLEAVVFEGEED